MQKETMWAIAGFILLSVVVLYVADKVGLPLGKGTGYQAAVGGDQQPPSSTPPAGQFPSESDRAAVRGDQQPPSSTPPAGQLPSESDRAAVGGDQQPPKGQPPSTQSTSQDTDNDGVED